MYVTVNGVRLFFDVEGAKFVPDGKTMREKPTLLLLHGGPGFDHSGFKPAFSAVHRHSAGDLPRSSRQRPQRSRAAGSAGTCRNGATTSSTSAALSKSKNRSCSASHSAAWWRWPMPRAIPSTPANLILFEHRSRAAAHIRSGAWRCSSASAARKWARWRAAASWSFTAIRTRPRATRGGSLAMPLYFREPARSGYGAPCRQPAGGAAVVHQTGRRERHLQHVPGPWPHPGA